MYVCGWISLLYFSAFLLKICLIGMHYFHKKNNFWTLIMKEILSPNPISSMKVSLIDFIDSLHSFLLILQLSLHFHGDLHWSVDIPCVCFRTTLPIRLKVFQKGESVFKSLCILLFIYKTTFCLLSKCSWLDFTVSRFLKLCAMVLWCLEMLHQWVFQANNLRTLHAVSPYEAGQ